MAAVNVHQAKARLSELIRRVLDGEEVVIARRNVPVVKLIAIRGEEQDRWLGWARGLIDMAPDFDETPDDFAEYSGLAQE